MAVKNSLLMHPRCKRGRGGIFESNPELWMSFERVEGGLIQNLSDFENTLSSESFDIDNPIFDFIISE